MTALDEITDSQLRGIIKMTGPDKDVHAGKNFLLLLLERGGKEQVAAFVEKSRKALSEEGSLDLAYDFTSAERELFKRSALNHINRAEFLGVHGWFWPGLIAVLTGGLDYVSMTEKALSRPKINPVNGSLTEREKLKQELKREILAELKQEKNDLPLAEKISQSIKERAGPAMEILIGAALVEESRKVREELKIEQISDAISQVVEAVTKLADKELTKERQATPNH